MSFQGLLSNLKAILFDFPQMYNLWCNFIYLVKEFCANYSPFNGSLTVYPIRLALTSFTLPVCGAYFETRTGLGLGLGLGPEENPDSGKTRTRARTHV